MSFAESLKFMYTNTPKTGGSHNTAVFYDVENLIGGYSVHNDRLQHLSIKSILNQIKCETGLESCISIHRAYANWVNPLLYDLREEINELAIDAVPVIGFGRDNKKNAADIQLAIDAIEIANRYAHIKNFVIVSGDGGFTALARKLHEYGKVVIGVANGRAANKLFESACDHFVCLQPLNHNKQEYTGIDQRNIPALKAMSVRQSTSDDPLSIAKALITCYVNTNSLFEPLPLSSVQQAINLLAPNLAPLNYGVARFSEFIQIAAAESKACVIKQDTQVALWLKALVNNGDERLPDLSPRAKHSTECYESILKAGSPVFKINNWVYVHTICVYLERLGKDIDITLDSLIDDLHTHRGVPKEESAATLLALENSGCLYRNFSTSEIKVDLTNYTTHEEAVGKLLTAMKDKLTRILGEPINEKFLNTYN